MAESGQNLRARAPLESISTVRRRTAGTGNVWHGVYARLSALCGATSVMIAPKELLEAWDASEGDPEAFYALGAEIIAWAKRHCHECGEEAVAFLETPYGGRYCATCWKGRPGLQVRGVPAAVRAPIGRNRAPSHGARGRPRRN